jgi:hypothetical protein
MSTLLLVFSRAVLAWVAAAGILSLARLAWSIAVESNPLQSSARFVKLELKV